MFRIFLVEDEKNLNEILTSYLEKEGWEIRPFTEGKSALEAIKEQPHLWILDIMLPDIDGYQLLRRIKEETPGVPVIFISARDADIDRIIGLEMGSDDYLAKPFLPRELVIRVQRVLERVYPNAKSKNLMIDLSPYVLDEAKREIRKGQEIINLTSKEYDLALLFAKHKGQALSRDQIINQVWGEDYVGTDRSVDDLVRRLRKKVPDLRIETIYGFGYRMISQ
ncbi:two-component system, OmpR family, response regulator CssR [Desulforamulus putei DSM 12395]|uniref:Stage 0 sporulation protein A homolog n=1 Tax=Desulforamulus putei DSM 12395 TaxID=1121429 RepID=A0A1M4W9I7_9FIRM|nr:response regulator transcription factor [Desulforamulus putei]SHE77904.1 two-component system, OmpR family, response regulator CssR [Desulforamulus putei DSM 12395]